MLDLEELTKLGVIDLEFAEHLKNNPTPPVSPEDATLKGRRRLMHERTVGFLGGNPDDLEEFEQSIPMHDGHESRSVIVKPKTRRTNGQPLIVLLFGGGFIAGEARQMVPYSRGFARLFDAICVCVEYRLAPENKFPAAALDAYSAVEWAAQNAKKLGASPEKGFLVGGVSAGGNLAAVVTALTVERKLQPKLTGQWLSIPALFEAEIVPEKYKKSWIAREQNAKAPGFNAEAIAGMYGAYQMDIRSAMFSPLMSKAQTKDLPKAYLQVCGMDPLRDDGIIYEDILSEAGVATRLDIYPGQVHAHWAFIPTLSASRKAVIDISKGIGWLLGTEVDDKDIAKAMEAPAAG